MSRRGGQPERDEQRILSDLSHGRRSLGGSARRGRPGRAPPSHRERPPRPGRTERAARTRLSCRPDMRPRTRRRPGLQHGMDLGERAVEIAHEVQDAQPEHGVRAVGRHGQILDRRRAETHVRGAGVPDAFRVVGGPKNSASGVMMTTMKAASNLAPFISFGVYRPVHNCCQGRSW